MILSIDTSTPVCSVALTDGNVLVAQRSTEGAQIHISALTPFIDEILLEADDAGKELKALGIAIGPGSFNGLRIGLATVKAIAWARDLPVIPIASLDALAHQLQGRFSGTARIVVYSHRNYLHFADYHLSDDGSFTTPDFRYGTFEDAFATVSTPVFGDDRGGLADWLNKNDLIDFRSLKANAAALGRLSADRLDSATRELHTLEPLYNATYHARKWVPSGPAAKP